MIGRYWELRPGTAWVDGALCVRHATVWYRRKPGRKYTQ